MTVHRLVPSEVEAENLCDLLEDVRAIPSAAFARLGLTGGADDEIVIELPPARD